MITPRLAALLIAACAATFIVTTSGNSLAPFLQVIATDTGTNLTAIAHLISFAAISWGAFSWLAGSASDRIGRKPILIAAMLLLAITRFGFAHAHSYAAALTWHVISGVAGGSFLGAVFACVSDHVPIALRGRALGWVITGQSLSMVLGVPLLTYIGSFVGWRGAFVVHAVMAIVSAVSLISLLPADPKRPPRAEHHRVSFASIAKPEFLVLLGAGTMERVCFASLAIYFATYLQQSYHLPFSELAGVLMLVAFG
ncbi:MAG: MFS transporter, partial [Burkholderiales bacterium]